MSALLKSKDRLRQTLVEVLGVSDEQLSDETSPATISSWDSLGHLNVVLALEDEFGIDLSAEDVLAMRDVGSIRRILQQSGVEV